MLKSHTFCSSPLTFRSNRLKLLLQPNPRKQSNRRTVRNHQSICSYHPTFWEGKRRPVLRGADRSMPDGDCHKGGLNGARKRRDSRCKKFSHQRNSSTSLFRYIDKKTFRCNFLNIMFQRYQMADSHPP